MNNTVKVGDVVRVKAASKFVGLRGRDMTVMREFVRGLFHCRDGAGQLWRLWQADLDVIVRPSELHNVSLILERRERAEALRAMKEARAARNREEFAHMEKLGVRLTKEGLPDGRVKRIRYTARTSPIGIKAGKRGL